MRFRVPWAPREHTLDRITALESAAQQWGTRMLFHQKELRDLKGLLARKKIVDERKVPNHLSWTGDRRRS